MGDSGGGDGGRSAARSASLGTRSRGARDFEGPPGGVGSDRNPLSGPQAKANVAAGFNAAGTARLDAPKASETPVSPIAGFLGLSEADRQANLNMGYAFAAGRPTPGWGGTGYEPSEGGGGDRQAELAAAAEAKGAAQPKPAPAPAPAAAPEPSGSAPRPAPRPAPAPQPAFDPASFMADIQERYDQQLQAIQQEIQAADAARAEQLAELTKQTDERKKKLKNPRKYDRLSLLSGSELGIPTTTTLG